jgi:Flp pilus assembly protein TadG
MRKRERSESGAAAVEFAIVLPVLLLILFGMINFGVVFAQNLALSNAARQAARFGAVDGRTCSDITSEAGSTVSGETIAYSQLSGMTTTVKKKTSGGAESSCATEACQGSSLGDSVKVTITADSSFLVPWIVPGVPNSVNISGKGEFRCEYS